MWAIGRYDRCFLPAKSSMSVCSRIDWPTDSSVHAMFACDSITPLGGPVVPEV